MLQNKFLFNQSSVSLEIVGLPDYSNNENKDHISIVTQWKLMIIDRPLIEGNIEHLISVMDAFYTYASSLLNYEKALYESNLIDIMSENYFTHNILLKSSKPEVKPLNIKIGNSGLADIINCFDQLGASNKVKKIYTKDYFNSKKKKYLKLSDKHNITKFILPPLISLSSILLISTALIYAYNTNNNNKYDNSLLNTKTLISIHFANTII